MKRNLFTIKDWPIAERPRERLIKQGPAALSNSELLAILLGTGSSTENVVDLAKRILAKHNLQEISQASITQIKEFRGINDAKACQLMACFELSKRLYTFNHRESNYIESAKDIAQLLFPDMRFLKKEQFVGVYLDSRNCLIKKEIISVGGLNTSIVHPRELFKTAIQESANSVIVAHNHPSGNPKPSGDDIEITKKIISAGRVIGIPIIDHVVIGEQGYFSMSEENIVRF
ncbi:DNA repair protein RadC [Candidatus Woesearchaeota archaeon]|nr:DNA repair protein RadC [Candidatus Woesearchaeota archaeon]